MTMISVGQTFTEKHTLAQSEFNRFAKLSGDDNPIHVDPEFSARTRFGKTVAHGMFLYSLVCGALAKHSPNASQVSQDLMFPAPSFVGEEITISLRVLEFDAAKNLTRVETIVTRPNGEIGLQGETTLSLRAA
ncbi:MAG: MaoC family dehydratase [Chloroflexi bacterium]|nr:MaoC family dehydratase [Chloroflexota bacterium]